MTICWKELQRFACQILCSAGVAEHEASLISAALVWTDLIGRYSHGTERLPIYLKRFRHGLIRSPCNPEFIQNSDTLFTLCGDHGFGHYLGHISMSRAIQTAHRHGVGIVGVRHSNHFGAAAYYVHMAAENLTIGMAFSNTTPQVAPHGGNTAVLGTNPLAFGAPTRSGQSVLVDFSTGVASGSTIRRAAEEQDDIPEGILINEEGDAVVDPAERAAILPFGGAKGFCVGLMVEILSGVITGSGISHGVASSYLDFERSCDIGHLFVAFDVTKMMPIDDYYERMELLVRLVKNTKTTQEGGEILIPGETRWRNHARQLAEGVSLEPRTIDSLRALAAELNVSIPWE